MHCIVYGYGTQMAKSSTDYAYKFMNATKGGRKKRNKIIMNMHIVCFGCLTGRESETGSFWSYVRRINIKIFLLWLIELTETLAEAK